MVKNTSISLVARNESNEIIGVCFGITDFAYWLFITDLGFIPLTEEQEINGIKFTPMKYVIK